ncbi:MAG: aminoglycoside phosphotransferase family protein [Desulfobulbaceae bacterium]|jgi:aminoglycoside phosphotransferase (APT) family kinase protein|nr:aminoglycoside phosphotransferase family protein [Desulfobulbaceae bacterium]
MIKTLLEAIRNKLDHHVIGKGTWAKVYRNGDVAVKRFYDAPIDMVEKEAKNQQFAHSAGLPVPAVHGVQKLDDGTFAIDMAYISGEPLMRFGMNKEEMRAVFNTLVKLQNEVHSVSAEGLPRVTERFQERIEHHSLKLDVPAKARLLALLSKLDEGCANLCHGDFHPLNVLFNDEGHWIIDWTDAGAGNPLLDVCRVYLLARCTFSSSVADMYLQCYCREAKVQPEEVLAWLPIWAALRLAEKTNWRERVLLRQIVNKWLHQS